MAAILIINQLTSRAALVLGCIFLLLMSLHITLDVIIRYFFSRGVVGTLEVVSFYYMVCAVFFPLAYVESRNEHITVDVFAQRLPEKIQFYLYIFACLAGLMYFGMLCYQSFLDAVRATQRFETAMANFKFYLWPSRWALPIGFFAICLSIIANIIKSINIRKPL